MDDADTLMKPKSRGLGRGLNALFEDDEDIFGGDSNTVPEGKSRERPLVAIEKLEPSRLQPRHLFDDESLNELAESIRTHGLLQPILVRKIESRDAYEIVAGERRWRASQRAQLHEVPVIVRDLSDVQALEIALIENLQREDLNPSDEALGYQKLMEEYNYTQEQLARALGKSRSHIANMVRMLTLPPEVLFYVEHRKITPGHARALITAKDPCKYLKIIMDQELSVRQTEALVAREERKKQSATSKKQKDVDTLNLEKELSNSIGMKVLINSKNGKSGKISIQFRNLDQLDALLKILSQ